MPQLADISIVGGVIIGCFVAYRLSLVLNILSIDVKGLENPRYLNSPKVTFEPYRRWLEYWER